MVVSIVLAEDAFIVREGIKMILEQAGYELCSAVEDYDQLMAAVEEHTPDVVITDIRMPPTRNDEGVRAAREIREAHPEIGVVVLSQYVEPDYALKLFEAGAAGLAYLLKERLGDIGQLEHAIAEVLAGRSVIDPRVVDALVEAKTRPESPVNRLTEREREVIAELGPGAIVGERAVLEGGVATATVTAITPVRTARISAENVDRSELEQVATGHHREES
jgi:DNA-binding NarL/FixJ family response regulator